MAEITNLKTSFNYEYYGDNAQKEKVITVKIAYEDITKAQIARFASKLTNYSDEAIWVRVWEHNKTHWELVHNWLSPEQAQEIKEHKESWED